jgi:hypothetical protein
MSNEKTEGSPAPQVRLVKNAILCRVSLWGPNSMAMSIDAELRREMFLVPKDVIAFRVMMWKGRRVMIGEKVPLSSLANLKEVPPEFMLRKDDDDGR